MTLLEVLGFFKDLDIVKRLSLHEALQGVGEKQHF